MGGDQHACGRRADGRPSELHQQLFGGLPPDGQGAGEPVVLAARAEGQSRRHDEERVVGRQRRRRRPRRGRCPWSPGRWGPCCSVAPTGTHSTAPAGDLGTPASQAGSRVTGSRWRAGRDRRRGSRDGPGSARSASAASDASAGPTMVGGSWATRAPVSVRAVAAARRRRGGQHPGPGPVRDRRAQRHRSVRVPRRHGGRSTAMGTWYGCVQRAGQRGPSQPDTGSLHRAHGGQGHAGAARAIRRRGAARRAGPPVPARVRLQGDQAEGLGGPELVGEEGGERARAPVGRTVAAHDQGRTPDGAWRRRRCPGQAALVSPARRRSRGRRPSSAGTGSVPPRPPAPTRRAAPARPPAGPDARRPPAPTRRRRSAGRARARPRRRGTGRAPSRSRVDGAVERVDRRPEVADPEAGHHQGCAAVAVPGPVGGAGVGVIRAGRRRRGRRRGRSR